MRRTQPDLTHWKRSTAILCAKSRRSSTPEPCSSRLAMTSSLRDGRLLHGGRRWGHCVRKIAFPVVHHRLRMASLLAVWKGNATNKLHLRTLSYALTLPTTRPAARRACGRCRRSCSTPCERRRYEKSHMHTERKSVRWQTDSGQRQRSKGAVLSHRLRARSISHPPTHLGLSSVKPPSTGHSVKGGKE